jgi:hypothetical protein
MVPIFRWWWMNNIWFWESAAGAECWPDHPTAEADSIPFCWSLLIQYPTIQSLLYFLRIICIFLHTLLCLFPHCLNFNFSLLANFYLAIWVPQNYRQCPNETWEIGGASIQLPAALSHRIHTFSTWQISHGLDFRIFYIDSIHSFSHNLPSPYPFPYYNNSIHQASMANGHLLINIIILPIGCWWVCYGVCILLKSFPVLRIGPFQSQKTDDQLAAFNSSIIMNRFKKWSPYFAFNSDLVNYCRI